LGGEFADVDQVGEDLERGDRRGGDVGRGAGGRGRADGGDQVGEGPCTPNATSTARRR
jgi:hypothetical protein